MGKYWCREAKGPGKSWKILLENIKHVKNPWKIVFTFWLFVGQNFFISSHNIYSFNVIFLCFHLFDSDKWVNVCVWCLKSKSQQIGSFDENHKWLTHKNYLTNYKRIIKICGKFRFYQVVVFVHFHSLDNFFLQTMFMPGKC